MAARVKVLAGPAQSGKTERLLSRYRQALTDRPPQSTLWLAPTSRAADDIRGRLLNRELTACLTPGVMTFARFAEEIVSRGPRMVRSLSGLMKRRMIARIVQQLHSRGELKHFGSIAHTPGLLDLVSEVITELKRLEIWPEHWESAFGDRGMRPKDRELWLIYREYQAQLKQHGLYDAEGRFWQAREYLQGGPQAPFDHLELVVLDGFADFTRTQHEIIELLSRTAGELWVSLPLEDPSDRADLFAKSRRTRDVFAQTYGGEIVECLPRPASTAWPAASHLERELFRNPRLQQPAASSAGIEVLEASRELDEIVLIGRRIKQLLLEGDPNTGEAVSPADIVVVLRKLGEASPLVREIFGELGIPFVLESDQPLVSVPALKQLMAWLQMHEEDWPLRGLLATLGSNYFRPRFPASELALAVRAAEKVLYQLGVPAGQNRLQQRLARFVDRYEQSLENSGSPPEVAALQDARRTQQLLDELQACFAGLPARGTYRAWSVALSQFVEQTGMLDAMAASGEAAALDRSGWAQLQASLQSLAELDDRLGDETVLSRREFLAQLADILRFEPLRQPRDETGRVRVLSAESVRALRVPYLFCGGLSEDSFPRPDRHDRIYSEAETRELNAFGLELAHHHARNQEEMLLFYEMITRATRGLFLSYPGLDEKAQPLLSSPYVAEVEMAFGPAVAKTVVQDLKPVPKEVFSPENRPVSESTWRIAAVSQALADKAKPPKLLTGFGQEHKATWQNMLAGLRVTHARSQREGFGPFEGILPSEEVQRDLLRRYAERTWSADALELFLSCPYRFFLRRVLHLEGPPDLELATDYMRRGQYIHDTLARLHRRINEEAGGRQTPTALAMEAARQFFREARDASVSAPDAEDALGAALFELEQRQLTVWEVEYFQQHADYDQAKLSRQASMLPAFFEVSFGVTPEEDLPPDPISRSEPLVLVRHGREVKLSGRIDRVDLGSVGGVPVFNILDYKSSGYVKYRSSAIESGQVLQLPLYALAVQEHLLAGDAPLPWQLGYWLLQKDGFKPAVTASRAQDDAVEHAPKWVDLRELILDRIFAAVSAIEGGQFPVYNEDKNCTSHCPFKTVCRINHVRSLEKTWELPTQPAESTQAVR